jgi:hypothetical protein
MSPWPIQFRFVCYGQIKQDEHYMDYQVEPRSNAMVPATARLPAAGYLNASMTSAVAASMIGEGLHLARDPSFAIGGTLAGATITVGTLGLIAGLSWLYRVMRNGPLSRG